MADPPRYPDSNSDIGDNTRTPRWVKVFGIIALALILLIVIMMFTGIGGEHGPGRHMRSGEPSGHTPPIQYGMQQP